MAGQSSADRTAGLKLTDALAARIQDIDDAKLEEVLWGAAMANDTVILTTLNAAWSEPGSVLDVFLESFRTGESTRELLDHLVIVSLDAAAHERCRQVHRHCFALITGGVNFSGQKNFMTDGYLKMMWSRINFLGQVLEKGFSFIFTVSAQISSILERLSECASILKL